MISEFFEEKTQLMSYKFIETYGLEINDAKVINMQRFSEFIDWLDERVDKLKSGDIVLKF